MCISYSYELVTDLLPDSYHKQLINIKKTQERKKRDATSDKNARGQAADAEDGDETLLKSIKKSQPERYLLACHFHARRLLI